MTRRQDLECASILPHGESARFVEEVVDLDDDQLVCVGRVPAESPFARGGMVPGFVLLEFAAQAAAIETLARRDRGDRRPRIGYLARGQGLSWTAEGVPAGSRLTASVYRADSIPPLYAYRASVTLNGSEVFGGKFSIYVDEDSDGT